MYGIIWGNTKKIKYIEKGKEIKNSINVIEQSVCGKLIDLFPVLHSASSLIHLIALHSSLHNHCSEPKIIQQQRRRHW